MIRLTYDPIDLIEVVQAVASTKAGATVTFIGTTREQNEGRQVTRLEYEAYEPMAERQLQAICNQVSEKWPEARVAVVHRLGEVGLGEASVVIAVSAPHRGEAFAACRYVIDELKKTVPIWKKEFFASGEVWIGTQDGRPFPLTGSGRR